ncbi:MAG: DUF4423 domain-containing protein, partial [Oligoflexia bacterium]|nr:DUF4423 domain-containing protein [Oligoflexia bacterium]
YRKIAHALRIHTTTVSQIFQGTKDLTLEQAQAATEYFGLSKLEARYFMTLVQLERAGSANLKTYFTEEAAAIRVQSQEVKNRVLAGKKLSDSDRAIFYSHWYYSAISLLTEIEAYRSPEAIAQITGLRLKRVREALAFLTSVGICIEKSGRYFPGETRTHIEKESPLASRHHANWRLRAIQAHENLGKEEIAFTAPLTLSRAHAKEAQALILQLIESISRIVAPSPSEELYCLNIDWVLLSERSEPPG